MNPAPEGGEGRRDFRGLSAPGHIGAVALIAANIDHVALSLSVPPVPVGRGYLIARCRLVRDLDLKGRVRYLYPIFRNGDEDVVPVRDLRHAGPRVKAVKGGGPRPVPHGGNGVRKEGRVVRPGELGRAGAVPRRAVDVDIGEGDCFRLAGGGDLDRPARLLSALCGGDRISPGLLYRKDGGARGGLCLRVGALRTSNGRAALHVDGDRRGEKFKVEGFRLAARRDLDAPARGFPVHGAYDLPRRRIVDRKHDGAVRGPVEGGRPVRTSDIGPGGDIDGDRGSEIFEGEGLRLAGGGDLDRSARGLVPRGGRYGVGGRRGNGKDDGARLGGFGLRLSAALAYHGGARLHVDGDRGLKKGQGGGVLFRRVDHDVDGVRGEAVPLRRDAPGPIIRDIEHDLRARGGLLVALGAAGARHNGPRRHGHNNLRIEAARRLCGLQGLVCGLLCLLRRGLCGGGRRGGGGGRGLCCLRRPLGRGRRVRRGLRVLGRLCGCRGRRRSFTLRRRRGLLGGFCGVLGVLCRCPRRCCGLLGRRGRVPGLRNGGDQVGVILRCEVPPDQLSRRPCLGGSLDAPLTAGEGGLRFGRI